MTQNPPLPDLDKNDYKPLYIQLSDLLADFIKDSVLVEGDALPSENELLARYDISRTTVRQAIQRLESQDLVRKIRGKGTFVTAPRRREFVRGFQNLEETLADQGVAVTNRLLEYQLVYPPQDWAQSLKIPSGEQALLLRRLKLADNSPLALEERLLPLEVSRRFSQDDFEDRPVFDVLEAFSEYEISRVTYTITSYPLTDEEAEALQVKADAPVIRRMGVYYGSLTNPIMFSRVTFLADRVELCYEFHKEDNNWGIVTVI